MFVQIIRSYCLGSGFSDISCWKNSVFSNLSNKQDLRLFSPEFALEEINKYSLDIMRKTKLSTKEFKDLLRIEEEYFKIGVGESREIRLDFIASEESIPDLYIGKIIVKGDEIEKEILVVIGIESVDPLFDVIVEILNKFRQVSPGEEAVANIKLFEVEKVGKVDVELEYSIRDGEGNIIVSDSETIAVEGQANFFKTLQISKNVLEGEYLFYVKANYLGQIAGASEWFNVSKEKYISRIEVISYIFLGIIVVILVVGFIILSEMKKVKKKIKYHHRRKST